MPAMRSIARYKATVTYHDQEIGHEEANKWVFRVDLAVFVESWWKGPLFGPFSLILEPASHSEEVVS